MDTFDRRRSFSLALGIAALGFAFLVSHVNGLREPSPAAPVSAPAASPDRG